MGSITPVFPAMKPTPDDLTLDQIQSRFATDKKARAYLESIRWPQGPVCPHCKATTFWRIKADKKKDIREGLYHCSACKKHYTVTVGTVFEDSKIPLRKWLVAFYLMSSSKKGIAALQIQRMLGLGSYRTAHFMCHRIRHAMTLTGFEKPLGGVVEVDSAVIGGKPRSYTDSRGIVRTRVMEKMPIVSMVERSGRKRSFAVQRITANTLHEAIDKHVAPHSALVTDEHTVYKRFRHSKKVKHHTVNHRRRQYTLKYNDKFTIHTNTVESSFSLLKRGIVGTFHSISPQYLPLYLAEFDHRWNLREITDGNRTVKGLRMIEGKRLKYGKPSSQKPATVATNEQQEPIR